MHFTRLTRSLLIRKVVKKVGKSTNKTTVYQLFTNFLPSIVQVAPKPVRPKPVPKLDR